MPRDPLICLAILLAPPPPKISRETGTKTYSSKCSDNFLERGGAEMEPVVAAFGGEDQGRRFPFS